MRNPHEASDDRQSTPLGSPIRKSEGQQQGESWKPLPENPRVLVNTRTGQFKTIDMSSGNPSK